jgi:acetate kinase
VVVSTGPVALCVNTGSSSLKAALGDASGVTQRRDIRLESPETLATALDGVIADLSEGGQAAPDVIGHRVVHGGADFAEPTLISDDVIVRLRALIPYAPLHQPAAITTIEQTRARFPGVPQVACFDTAFHRRLPEAAQRLPLPERYWTEGLRRYGFHGLSYEYIVGRLGDRLGPRTVIAHLGGGSSLVALRDGRPVDTTMSLTPGGGLVMATRSGDLDPGVVLELLRLEGDAARVGEILERESGLRGISDLTGDVKTLVEASDHDGRAREALATFTLSAAKHIAAATTVLGGLDTLVFTGGVGAASAPIRRAIAARLDHLGVVLDPIANDAGAEVVSPPEPACTVFALPTDEEAVIAGAALRVLRP